MIRNLIKERDGQQSSGLQTSANTSCNVKPKTAKRSRHKSLHNMFKNQWELQKEYAAHVIQEKHKDKDEKINKMFNQVRLKIQDDQKSKSSTQNLLSKL
jgi:hypothetical protein